MHTGYNQHILVAVYIPIDETVNLLGPFATVQMQRSEAKSSVPPL